MSDDKTCFDVSSSVRMTVSSVLNVLAENYSITNRNSLEEKVNKIIESKFIDGVYSYMFLFAPSNHTFVNVGVEESTLKELREVFCQHIDVK